MRIPDLTLGRPAHTRQYVEGAKASQMGLVALDRKSLDQSDQIFRIKTVGESSCYCDPVTRSCLKCNEGGCTPVSRCSGM